MKTHTLFIAAVAAVSWIAPAAAATQHTADDLGGTLTRFGAIKAGNEAGTIPAYTGGLKVTDPAYSEKPDPFASEEPRLVITSKNWKQYKDKLDPGQEALFKRYSDYRMYVYPTHRTTSYPDWLLKKTVENASNPECKIISNGL